MPKPSTSESFWPVSTRTPRPEKPANGSSATCSSTAQTLRHVESDDGTPVNFSTDGLKRLLRGLREAGIGAEHFPWPPPNDPGRAPYRGWQPMDDADAAVFFGRDPQVLRGLDTLRGMRAIGVDGLLVVLGPSGVGKSSFLRAGLLPRLRRDQERSWSVTSSAPNGQR